MHLRRMLRRLYETSPQHWLTTARARLSRLRIALPLPQSRRSDSHLATPIEAPQTRILDSEFFAHRNPLVQSLIERIRRGEPLASVLRGIPARQYDERLVEYPVFADWLLSRNIGSDILDVGCVLNNRLVSNLLGERCGAVWFCNPSVEQVCPLTNPTFYHVADLANAFAGGTCFPLVTCLSTIEHIGYDNSQYGGTQPARFTDPRPETLAEACRSLIGLTAPSGGLLITVPYGFAEALVHPVTQKIASQVFDERALQSAITTLRNHVVDCELRVFQAFEDGWTQVNPASCTVRYADGCPAAAAVAVITATRAAS